MSIKQNKFILHSTKKQVNSRQEHHKTLSRCLRTRKWPSRKLFYAKIDSKQSFRKGAMANTSWGKGASRAAIRNYIKANNGGKSPSPEHSRTVCLSQGVMHELGSEQGPLGRQELHPGIHQGKIYRHGRRQGLTGFSNSLKSPSPILKNRQSNPRSKSLSRSVTPLSSESGVHEGFTFGCSPQTRWANHHPLHSYTRNTNPFNNFPLVSQNPNRFSLWFLKTRVDYSSTRVDSP